MPRRDDIDRILKRWEYSPGEVSVRSVKAQDGRQVLQMRVEMGVLQLEADGRPDGQRPEGFETYFDYLTSCALHEGEDFVLTTEQCAEVDRELIQFYHRRISWLALKQYDRAMRDADHTLALMDFIKPFATDDDWVMAHEQYRPFILFHRTEAAALVALEEDGPELAIETINDGLEQMRAVFDEFDAEEQFEDDEMVNHLGELREALRNEYDIGPTLLERLNKAVAREEYELAAHLRDEIARRGKSQRT